MPGCGLVGGGFSVPLNPYVCPGSVHLFPASLSVRKLVGVCPVGYGLLSKYILLWSACTQIKRCIPPKNGPWSLALSVARARKFSRKFLSFATPRPDHHSKVFSHWAKSSAPIKFVKSSPKQPSRQTPLACARQVVLAQIHQFISPLDACCSVA